MVDEAIGCYPIKPIFSLNLPLLGKGDHAVVDEANLNRTVKSLTVISLAVLDR